VKEKGGGIIFEWPTGIRGWDLPEVKEMEEEFEMQKIFIHGCTMGVCADEDMTKPIKKPWTIMTSMIEVVEVMEGRKCPGNHVHTLCQGRLTEGTGRYPMKMAHLLHVAMEKFWLRRDRQRAEEAKEEGIPKIKSMAEHVARGHIPHRSDCKACIEGSGRTKPHRRTKHPEAAVLSLDVAGPFKEGYDKGKYFLVGAYTIIKESTRKKKKPYEEKVLQGQDAQDEEDIFKEEEKEK
jgi:hypothetical protein